MIEDFLKEWMTLGARLKNIVVLDARQSMVGKSDLRRVFSDRYFEMDPALILVLDEAKGFALTQKSPVVLIDSDVLASSLKSLMGETLNLKIVGMGDKKVANLVREIPGWEVMMPQSEYELKQIIPKIESHFGPLYIHML